MLHNIVRLECECCENSTGNSRDDRSRPPVNSRLPKVDAEISTLFALAIFQSTIIGVMQLQRKCALCHEVKPLCDSHFLPAGLYRLARTHESPNPHPVLITGGQWQKLSEQSRAFVLCRECETRFDHDGESWMLRHCCRGKGRFRLRERLLSRIPSFVDGETSMYSASEEDVRRLTYFAMSVFWRGAAFHWPIGRDFSQLLRLGPFEEQIRRYLLTDSPLPTRTALIVCVSSRSHPPLGSAYPMSYTDSKRDLFHRFHIPGLMFTLYLGQSAEAMRVCSVTDTPVHPIWVGSMSDDNFMSESRIHKKE